MISNEKNAPEKIHCIFHQKADCSCIEPVANTKNLITRIENQIGINNILNRHEPDAEIKRKRNEQTILLENRLSDLEKSSE